MNHKNHSGATKRSYFLNVDPNVWFATHAFICPWCRDIDSKAALRPLAQCSMSTTSAVLAGTLVGGAALAGVAWEMDKNRRAKRVQEELEKLIAQRHQREDRNAAVQQDVGLEVPQGGRIRYQIPL